MHDLDKKRKVLFEAADEASNILVRNFNKEFGIGRKKEYNDLVTEVDRESEAKIIEVIHSHFPDHNVLSEECGNLNMDSDHLWIVDPIDGTVNYAHSVPVFCVSIALAVDKEVELGLVYNPITNEKFFGQKNGGSYLNGKKISVSQISSLKDGLLVTGFPYGAKGNVDHCIDHFNNFIREGLPIRRLGSAALDICYVASGRFDGFWEVSLNPWDVAAGYVILTEAGGDITDFTGEKYSIFGKQILASNGKIHTEMMKVLKKAYE